LFNAVQAGEDVTISYGGGSVVDSQGNPVSSFSRALVNLLNPAIASDVTTSVEVVPLPAIYNPLSKRYIQVVVVRNSTLNRIEGPLSFVFDNLDSRLKVEGTTGTTSCTSPLSSSYVDVGIGFDEVFNPREIRVFVVRFAGPRGVRVTYSPRLLAGAGCR
jgi:hypothetical protein